MICRYHPLHLPSVPTVSNSDHCFYVDSHFCFQWLNWEYFDWAWSDKILAVCIKEPDLLTHKNWATSVIETYRIRYMSKHCLSFQVLVRWRSVLLIIHKADMAHAISLSHSIPSPWISLQTQKRYQRVQLGGWCCLSWIWWPINLTKTQVSHSIDCSIIKAGKDSFWLLV